MLVPDKKAGEIGIQRWLIISYMLLETANSLNSFVTLLQKLLVFLSYNAFLSRVFFTLVILFPNTPVLRTLVHQKVSKQRNQYFSAKLLTYNCQFIRSVTRQCFQIKFLMIYTWVTKLSMFIVKRQNHINEIYILRDFRTNYLKRLCLGFRYTV